MKMLQERFRALTEREQYLVIVSGVLIVIAVFYWGILAPLNSALTQQQNELERQQELLVWVADKARRAQQLRRANTGTSVFTGSLPQAVNASASRNNIAITRMQPQGEELQVWVDQAAFNDVLAWLQAMENMGIVIMNADITEADAAGYVKIRRLQLGKA